MTSLNHRFEAFRHDVARAAEKHDLIFVNGPGPQAVAEPQGTKAATNGQERLTILIGIADAHPQVSG